MTRTTALLAAAVAALVAVPSPASAARPQRAASRSEMLSFWGVLDPGPIDGVGVGGRVMLPLGQGILQHPRVRDEFALEFGADFVHYEDRVGFDPFYVDYSWNGFLPVVGATWNFWLTPRFALYPKLDLGWWFGWYDGWDDGPGYGRADFDGVFLQGAVGAVFRFRSAAFRVEAGSGLLRIGVGLPF
jgi:hypothetical protein